MVNRLGRNVGKNGGWTTSKTGKVGKDSLQVGIINYIKVYDKIQHSFVGDDILYYAICMI